MTEKCQKTKFQIFNSKVDFVRKVISIKIHCLLSWYTKYLYSELFAFKCQNTPHTGQDYYYVGRAKRICYLSPMRAAKVQASLRIRAVSPEPSLLAHTSSESRGTFRQKARSLAPLNGWACAVEICHDGMLEDTNSLDAAHVKYEMKRMWNQFSFIPIQSILVMKRCFFYYKWAFIPSFCVKQSVTQNYYI